MSNVEIRNTEHSSPATARRGSAYFIVLMISLIVTVIGLSSLTVSRIQARSAAGMNDWAEATSLAFSAVEHAMTTINTDPSWRTNIQNGVETSLYALGNGSFKWKVEDEFDNTLSDDVSESARVTGTGLVGDTVRIYSVLLQPSGAALPAILTPAHCGQDFNITSTNVTLTVNGGPLSTNSNLALKGTIDGDIEAATTSGSAVVLGNQAVPAPPKTMPSTNVIDLYRIFATKISWSDVDSGSGTFQPGLLSSNSNPYGPTNPEAVYFIQVPGNSQLTIDKSRLIATLLIKAGNNVTIYVVGEVLWEPHRQDFPLLIATGNNLIVKLNSSPGGLSEASAGKNLNPAGSAFEGGTDSDMVDIYPAELRGLVQVCGTNSQVRIESTLISKGSIICEDKIVVGDPVVPTAATLNTAQTFVAYPPLGYTTGDPMVPIAGTWRWDLAP